MYPPHQRLHRLTVIVDGIGQTCGAVLVTDYGTDAERVQPFEPGPFDTPHEVLERLLSGLDTQMSLW